MEAQMAKKKMSQKEVIAKAQEARIRKKEELVSFSIGNINIDSYEYGWMWYYNNVEVPSKKFYGDLLSCIKAISKEKIKRSQARDVESLLTAIADNRKFIEETFAKISKEVAYHDAEAN